MEMIFKEQTIKDKNINFKIKGNEINGITGNNLDALLEIINLKHKYSGKIIIDKTEVNKNNINEYRKRISIINEDLNEVTFYTNIYELMYQEVIRKKINIKNPEKKIKDSMKIVGLDEAILNKNVDEISRSEKKLLQLAIGLLSNPNLLVLVNFFKSLDIKNEKKIIMLLNKMKDQYNRTIIIASNNSEIIYKYTKHVILINNDEILFEGKTDDLYQNVEFLKNNKIDIPEIVEFTYLAKKRKSVKIDFHKDIRDIIKDIYKHV